MVTKRKQHRVLPGFGLSMGYTLIYLSLIILIPIAVLFLKATTISLAEFWETVTDERVVASYKLTIYTSFIAAFVNAIFGTLIAWVLVRYEFYGKRIIDALVDLPLLYQLRLRVSPLPPFMHQMAGSGNTLNPSG